MKKERFMMICESACNLHVAKNADYGHDDLGFVLGLRGRFSDIFRKVARLKTKIWDNKEFQVNENVKDTAVDLVVYAVMLCDEIMKGDSNDKNKPT